VPANKAFEQIGKLPVSQWPIKIGDVVLGAADQKDAAARRVAGPSDRGKRSWDQSRGLGNSARSPTSGYLCAGKIAQV
jgi:hypothetical protein